VASDALIRPVCELDRDNESEKMDDASVETTHLANSEVGGAVVKDICYNNAAGYFGFDLPHD